jgi:Domain of unknown function (DUF4126)
MSAFLDAAPELIILLPLSIAAGLDLYLTLLFLGAAPTTTWWGDPLPGALGDLDSLSVMIVVGTFYLLEFAAERFPTASLVWNAFHAVIRPVSGALLALLLLEGHPTVVVLVGAVAAGGVASAAHAIRSGASILRWLGTRQAPHPVVVSLLEDAVVLGLVALVIDQQLWALGAALLLGVGGAVAGAPRVRAFAFAVKLAAGRVFTPLGPRRWTDTEGFPSWVRSALAGDVMAPGGGLRGSPVAAHRLPNAPRFTTGWLVVTGDAPVFVFKRWREPRIVDLEQIEALSIVETNFFRRVELGRSAEPGACIFFSSGGPSTESLKAEFLFG